MERHLLCKNPIKLVFHSSNDPILYKLAVARSIFEELNNHIELLKYLLNNINQPFHNIFHLLQDTEHILNTIFFVYYVSQKSPNGRMYPK